MIIEKGPIVLEGPTAMMDWVYMAPDLPGDMLMAQDRLGFDVADDYQIDSDAVNALQVRHIVQIAILGWQKRGQSKAQLGG